MYGLINYLKASIGYEGSRDANTFLCLVVLQERSHDAWQCQSRTIQRVAEFSFLSVLTAVAALQSPDGGSGTSDGWPDRCRS